MMLGVEVKGYGEGESGVDIMVGGLRFWFVMLCDGELEVMRGKS